MLVERNPTHHKCGWKNLCLFWSVYNYRAKFVFILEEFVFILKFFYYSVCVYFEVVCIYFGNVCVYF